MALKEQTADGESRVGSILFGKNRARTRASVGVLLALGCIAYLIFGFLLLPVQVDGISMAPTFQNGEINFINRLAYAWHEPQRGDVVGVRFSGRHTMYCKRIVGMPGETVAFEGGRILINGKVLPEPYLKNTDCNWQAAPRQLGPEEYYVVGDNRGMPFQDHYKGGAERKRIVGKVFLGGNSQG